MLDCKGEGRRAEKRRQGRGIVDERICSTNIVKERDTASATSRALVLAAFEYSGEATEDSGAPTGVAKVNEALGASVHAGE